MENEGESLAWYNIFQAVMREILEMLKKKICPSEMTSRNAAVITSR